MMRIIQSAFYMLLLLFSSFVLKAQETSTGINGSITDTLQHRVAGAIITVIHLPSGTKYTAVTTADGRYSIPGIRVGGPYLISVNSIGMQAQGQQVAQIRLGEPLTLNFALSAATTQLGTVTVKGTGRSKAKANTYGTGLNIGRDQIASVPSISRSITDITKMVPQGSRDNSFAGSNFRYNNVTVDGAVNNDAIGFSASAGGQTGTSNMPGSSTRTNSISLDAIEDMQVYLAPYDIKIGNFTGGSINAVTRSGTNIVTGSIYAYGRNAAVTGPDRTGQEQNAKMDAGFHEYQTGFRVGFPIIKNKLFFFTNEEVTERQDVIQQVAGSNASATILSQADAEAIRNYTVHNYNFDPGSYGVVNAYSRSKKFFNRLDWNVNSKTQITIRNNTILSEAINMERDQFNFRFSSIAYKQKNNQSSTVGEIKTRFTDRLSNSLILGASFIHDSRDPLSSADFPQVQIVGKDPGSTIFLGTDREAAIFNMKQRTFEISDNVLWRLGKHTLTLGTHNELYKVNYGFVNSWNGRVTYQSIADYLAGKVARVQGSFNYKNNDRDYILDHPEAVFNINFLSGYVQDELQISDRFKLTLGVRLDKTLLPEKPDLSWKVKQAETDPTFGRSYTYTPLNQINEEFLNKPQASFRIGFRGDPLGNQRLIIRGGSGLFTGRIPFAWLGYAFYNTGDTYGSYDQKATGSEASPFVPGTDPLKRDPNNPHPGIAGFVSSQGKTVNDANAGTTQVDVIDNRFVMPQVLRSSVAVEYTDGAGFKYLLEGLFTKTIKDVLFQQVNLKDNPTYYAYDTATGRRNQPVYSGSVNPWLANAYELSNTSKGYKYSITGQVSRTFNMGLNFSVAYTYGKSKDVSNGIRNSMESNWQLNQALNPNNPGLAYSNFDLRHRIIAQVRYMHAWNRVTASTFSLFGSVQSGSPFTYGFVNYTAQGTPQQVSLAYIPYAGQAISFFKSYVDEQGQPVSAQQQADAFNRFIDNNEYLSSRRGMFTERNMARTPWNYSVDFHFQQDLIIKRTTSGENHVISFTWDILNLTNLISKQWGLSYFASNTYNSTSSVGLVPYIPGVESEGYPVYKFRDPGKPYSTDLMASRWQMQFGLRYGF